MFTVCDRKEFFFSQTQKMNLPQCVVNCTDPELKEKATIIFNRGTREDKLQIMADILLEKKVNVAIDVVERRRKKMKEWSVFSRHAYSVTL